MAGAQLFDIVVRPADGDRSRMVETMAAGRRTAFDPVDGDWHNLFTEQRHDRMQRPNPAQRRGGTRCRAPTHRFWPGEIADDAGDRLGQHVAGRASGLLDYSEPSAVAILKL